MKAELVTALIHTLEEQKFPVHGIEVFQDGTVIEKHHFQADIRYPVYSATKSVTSTAVGLAVAEGKMQLQDPLAAYLPSSALAQTPRSQREAFEQLPITRFLTMSIPGYPFRPEGTNYLAYALSCPVDYNAPAEFAYSNIPAYLVGVAVTNAVGMHLADYLQPRLFAPLGIQDPVWQDSPEGYFYGASGMQLTVHELSLLGQLYLQQGNWQGTQILSREWVREATRCQIANREGGYGYYFWRYGAGYRISGKWGQRCLIFPKGSRCTDGSVYAHDLMITYLSDMPQGSEQVSQVVEEVVLRPERLVPTSSSQKSTVSGTGN
ncbi:MAG: serine hydrolase [Lachnospiraceae bacterium]|nr:serine hydrolase [Lachnospiraceae bacterium]